MASAFDGLSGSCSAQTLIAFNVSDESRTPVRALFRLPVGRAFFFFDYHELKLRHKFMTIIKASRGEVAPSTRL